MSIAKSQAYQKRAYNPNDWITRDEAIQLLGVTRQSFKNLLYSGKIPDKYISVGPTSAKFFYKPGLMGFDN